MIGQFSMKSHNQKKKHAKHGSSSKSQQQRPAQPSTKKTAPDAAQSTTAAKSGNVQRPQPAPEPAKKSPRTPTISASGRGLPKSAIFALIALLFGAGILYFAVRASAPAPTATAPAPTATAPAPTATAPAPTATAPAPTATAPAPTATAPAPTATAPAPTATAVPPTATAVPPTATAPPPTATAPPPTATAPAAATYIVKNGDSCSKIARTLKVRTEDLIAVNGLTGRCIVRQGQVLRIPDGAQPSATPPPTRTRVPTARALPTRTPAATIDATSGYVVVKGDSCSKIARRLNVRLIDLRQANNLDERCLLAPGRVLTIP